MGLQQRNAAIFGLPQPAAQMEPCHSQERERRELQSMHPFGQYGLCMMNQLVGQVLNNGSQAPKVTMPQEEEDIGNVHTASEGL